MLSAQEAIKQRRALQRDIDQSHRDKGTVRSSSYSLAPAFMSTAATVRPAARSCVRSWRV